MGYLHFQHHNIHQVSVEDRNMLFHIPTTALFEIDPLDTQILGYLSIKRKFDERDIRDQFTDQDPAELAAKLKSYKDLDIVNDGRGNAPEHPDVKIENFPLTTIVLNVNTGCNLSCTYCYKEDLDTPSAGRKMAFDTAVKSIELLLKENPDRDSYNIVFFGGEPLSNLSLIKEVVAYAEPLFEGLGKMANFSLTTNATLLNEKIVDWLDEHKFGLTISMDGPKALHDLNRKTVGGKGSYDVVAAKSRMLLERYRSRSVGVRVTLTAGVTAVEEIWDHLKNDIGFAEVGFSPVTSGDMTAFNLSTAELNDVFEGMKSLGQRYLHEAVQGNNIGFSNMHQMMQDLFEGRSKALPCGAGVGMLAVDHEGEINLCHRFTGSKMESYGNVEDGIARDRLSTFIEARADLTDKSCATCQIRNLCAGGCYHESYAHFADPLSPTYHYCDLMRDWVDFGIGIYGELVTKSPSFFNDHISPRRAFGK